MKKLVVFGLGEMAEVCRYYFEQQADWTVAAFTVDGGFIKEPRFLGLPVVPFDKVTKEFPPRDHAMFIAVGFSKINKVREQKYTQAREWGYTLASFVSSRATVYDNVKIGDNCFILENNTLQPFVEIGNNVIMWSGNHIGHHVRIRDHSFIASHAVMGGGAVVGSNCFIGMNATIRDHIEIGKDCVIGAGALVLEDAAAGSVYKSIGTSPSKVPSRRLGRL